MGGDPGAVIEMNSHTSTSREEVHGLLNKTVIQRRLLGLIKEQVPVSLQVLGEVSSQVQCSRRRKRLRIWIAEGWGSAGGTASMPQGPGARNSIVGLGNLLGEPPMGSQLSSEKKL